MLDLLDCYRINHKYLVIYMIWRKEGVLEIIYQLDIRLIHGNKSHIPKQILQIELNIKSNY